MELLKAAILGCVQGATEFLPVSSSGHLVLGSHLLGFSDQSLLFDVMLHLGTLVSVVLVFRRDVAAMIGAPFRWLGGGRSREVTQALLWDLYVVLATIPAVIVGLSLKDRIEQLFSSTPVVYVMLMLTGILMIASRHLHDRGNKINGWRAVIIGIGQACAILPGLSRSGTTIFTGMALGINREAAARFSFLMSLPAIVGAAVLQLGEAMAHPPSMQSLINIGVGTALSVVTGCLAIILLLDVVKRNRLPWFGYYCLVVAGIGLTLLFLGR